LEVAVLPGKCAGYVDAFETPELGFGAPASTASGSLAAVFQDLRTDRVAKLNHISPTSPLGLIIGLATTLSLVCSGQYSVAQYISCADQRNGGDGAANFDRRLEGTHLKKWPQAIMRSKVPSAKT
jgi:hypothetical protein